MDGSVTEARRRIESEVNQRAVHDTPEKVRVTCSFARMERLLGREYHGRFLIELLQNAADAWRRDQRASDGSRSRVAVVISKGPALLVANEGVPLTAAVVIESLGHLGASDKPEGEAIGHKGIGFKSVLEITGAPEVYSRSRDGELGLAVRFDPEVARSMILKASPDWDSQVKRVLNMDEEPWSAIPVLRYPEWVDDIPDDVQTLLAENFDTVVRLPFDERFAERLRLSRSEWLEAVRRSLGDVSDQMLVLLGTFSEVRIVDTTGAPPEVVQPTLASTKVGADGVWRESLVVERNHAPSSRWRLFRRSLPNIAPLAGEIAVGIRLDGDADTLTVVPATDEEASTPFHLFFPTRIPSGTPFLLHGYFEVGAARTTFYEGSRERNQTILNSLAELTALATYELASSSDVDMSSLVNSLASSQTPDDPLAYDFREALLTNLDRYSWVPAEAVDGVLNTARPVDVLVTRPELTARIAKAFRPEYVYRRVGMRLPDPRLSDSALHLIESRLPNGHIDLWGLLADLMRPGQMALWPSSGADEGFLSLLDLIEALQVDDRSRTRALLEGLRGDPLTRLLPVMADSDTRNLLPVPDPQAQPGVRSRLVMARLRQSTAAAPVPPDALEIAFLRDGLLQSDGDFDRARPLGVRQFTVDNLLNRLNGLDQADIDPAQLLRFLWGVLSREPLSRYGTKKSKDRSALLDPDAWFWCSPGRAREDETSQDHQQRLRHLSRVRLPSRDGRWRPAGELMFGKDWAAWLETSAVLSVEQRSLAYRDLEAIAPGDHAMIAAPEVVLSELEFGGNDGFISPDPGEEPWSQLSLDAERHAFLLRLGVWEVPALEAFSNYQARQEDKFPWSGPLVDRQRAFASEPDGWQFGLDNWNGHRHGNVNLAEDYRLLWPLDSMAGRDPEALARAMNRGVDLYARRLNAQVFCPACTDSGPSHPRAPRYSTSLDGYPSVLSLQLGQVPWMRGTVNGKDVGPVEASQAWWHHRPPTGSGVRQSPWQFVPLCGPASGIGDQLRRIAGVKSLDEAGLPELRRLLTTMKSGFEEGSLATDPGTSGSSRQAFVGLHRQAYDRLAVIADQEADDVTALLEEIGVLCELGDSLCYLPPCQARHDDGRFAAYVRYFVGEVAFSVVARDREAAAKRLEIPRFQVNLSRRGDDGGRDVTDQLADILGDRIHELMAILVHHSLGTQPLELASEQFETRSRRLKALTVRQVPDLVIDARLDDGSVSVTIGEGSDQDIYLQGPTSVTPILFHDLSGPSWPDRLRRKIAYHLATIVENPAYAHTFALFLQGESDAEREEFLLDLGITSEEVDAVAGRIGTVSVEDRARAGRWFTGILLTLSASAADLDVDASNAQDLLERAGLTSAAAAGLVEAGGGESVRSDTEEGSPLRLLADSGLDLRLLQEHLAAMGDEGLNIPVARRLLGRWVSQHGRRCSAVLDGRVPTEVAKVAPFQIAAPPELALALDPPLERVLARVVDLLRANYVDVSAAQLAEDAGTELARAGGFPSEAALDERVLLLFDEDEQARALGQSAARWRHEILILAVLARIRPAETRSSIRVIDEAVHHVVPGSLAKPSELAAYLPQLFPSRPGLTEGLEGLLSDSLSAAGPDRNGLLALAANQGVPIGRMPDVLRALVAPRRDEARETRKRASMLTERGIYPRPPAGMPPAPRRELLRDGGKMKVAAIKVVAGRERRNKELGDEGEKWALAAIVRSFIDETGHVRPEAVDEVVELLGKFEGQHVEAALAHADLVRSRELDEDEIVDELSRLLHVSRYGDGFGFDIVGWLPPEPGVPSQAMCLEAKSSVSANFHLSRGEWSLANSFADRGEGDRYAVLVVRRARVGGIPECMDLLVDPVSLVAHQTLAKTDDGYVMTYGDSLTSSTPVIVAQVAPPPLNAT